MSPTEKSFWLPLRTFILLLILTIAIFFLYLVYFLFRSSVVADYHNYVNSFNTENLDNPNTK